MKSQQGCKCSHLYFKYLKGYIQGYIFLHKNALSSSYDTLFCYRPETWINSFFSISQNLRIYTYDLVSLGPRLGLNLWKTQGFCLYFLLLRLALSGDSTKCVCHVLQVRMQSQQCRSWRTAACQSYLLPIWLMLHRKLLLRYQNPDDVLVHYIRKKEFLQNKDRTFIYVYIIIFFDHFKLLEIKQIWLCFPIVERTRLTFQLLSICWM